MADKENLHKDHRQRMMKKYVENGIDSFEEHEILEILLFNIFTRCNTNDIGHRLLNEFKTIKGVINASESELTTVKGVGENAATKICFLGDFYRYLATEPSSAVVLDTNDRVFQFCKEIADISAGEFFMILFLDKKNTLLTKYLVNGQFNYVSASKRDIAVRAVFSGCTGAVAVHNHFGEVTKPSSADITNTEMLRDFLSELSVNLYEHLIITQDGFLSMRKHRSCNRIWL